MKRLPDTPSDHELFELFTSLRVQVASVVTDMVGRVEAELDRSMSQRSQGPEPARVAGSLFSQISNLLASLVGWSSNDEER